MSISETTRHDEFSEEEKVATCFPEEEEKLYLLGTSIRRQLSRK